MHNDNDLAMRFIEQHITQLLSLFPLLLLFSIYLVLVTLSSAPLSSVSLSACFFSFALAHTSFIYSLH